MEDLTAELLEEILAPLSLSDISRLSRTCKEFYNFLSPRVYHTIDWFWKDDGVCPPFDLLLRTLLSNSRLARTVKVLTLRGGGIVKKTEWRNDTSYVDRGYTSGDGNVWRPVKKYRSIWAEDDSTKASYEKNDIRMVENRVSPFYRPKPKVWKKEFERGNVDVFVALIVSCIQAVERLDIGFGYLHRSVFLPGIFRHLCMEQKWVVPYPDLIAIDFALDAPISPEGFWSDLDLMRPIFFLPRLKSISTVFAEPVIFAWPTPTVKPSLTSLSTLVLRKTTAHEDTLGALLSCTPQLKHLVFEHHRMTAGEPHWECAHYCPQELYPFNASPCQGCSRDYPEEEQWHIIRCRRLDKALSHVRCTLESLVLKIAFELEPEVDVREPMDNWCNDGKRTGVTGHISVLSRMPNLAKLEIPWVLLFGWEADMPLDHQTYWQLLPKLRITDDVFDLSPFQWSTVIPSALKQICLRDDMSELTHYQYSARATVALLEKLVHDERKTSCPALDTISFHFAWHDPDMISLKPNMYSELHEETLRNICAQYEIECHVHWASPPR